MDYIEVSVKIDPFTEENSEIVLSVTEGFDFESFSVEEPCVKCYIKAGLFTENILEDLVKSLSEFPSFKSAVEHSLVKGINWNSVWESNFSPLVIDGICTVKASFHKDLPDTKYNIVIDPKMAFGTGHHQTTHLMSSNLLNESVSGNRVLDMGCGTAILAILAAKMGAAEVVAVDNDPDAVNSAIENSEKNGVSLYIKPVLGDAGKLRELGQFSIILANINRNIVINDMSVYSASLIPGGILLLSGFYSSDIELVRLAGEKTGLKFVNSDVKDEWAFIKMRLEV